MTDAAGLCSMTGFGAARVHEGGVRLEVEARSVNHRHLKVNVRSPEAIHALAPRLEELVRKRLRRGTVYVTVRCHRDDEGAAFRLDAALLRRFFAELTTLAGDLNVAPPDLGRVALLPGVVRQEEPDEADDALWALLERTAAEALTELEAMRRTEGAGLAADLRGAAREIAATADEVERKLPTALEEQAARLRARVQQLLDGSQGLEASELAREVAVLADKSDISEELQRLRSHVAQLEEALGATDGPVGRKLEFLAQELLRESNTMASKSHDTAIVQAVLAIKLLVDRIREQVANVE